MKPQLIRADDMSRAETRRIVRWMESNGLRHYVPRYAPIRVHGNRFTVATFDIERVEQIGTKWARHRWIKHPGGLQSLPIKDRTYRIRHELKDTK